MDKIARCIAANMIAFGSSALRVLFPFHRGVCRFYPTCTAYSIEAVQKLPLPLACIKIIWRILRCSPLSHGGYDPVTKEG